MRPLFGQNTHSRTPITVVRNHFVKVYFSATMYSSSLISFFSSLLGFYSPMKYSSGVIHSCEKETGEKSEKRKIQRKLMIIQGKDVEV